MPNMDGFELTRRLRPDPRTATVSVIMLTARGLSADKLEGFAIGARANVHVKILYGRSNHHQIEALFKAVIQAVPGLSRMVAMACCDTMPRSPTMTNCSIPNCSRSRVSSGRKV